MKKYLNLILGELLQVVKGMDERETQRFLNALRSARRIYIAGVGRSGLVVKAFGQRLMHLGYSVHLADEITAPAIGRRDILVCCSGTGRTHLVIYMARKARSVGARTITLTADPASPLAKLSGVVVRIPAPLEPGRTRKGVTTRQPARSLFEQVLLIYLDAIILEMMARFRIPKTRVERRHGNLE